MNEAILSPPSDGPDVVVEFASFSGAPADITLVSLEGEQTMIFLRPGSERTTP